MKTTGTYANSVRSFESSWLTKGEKKMASVTGKTSGFKSSEFWLNLVGMIAGIIIATLEQSQGDNQWLTLAGGVLSAVCGASYANSRAKIKSSLMGAEAVAEAGKQQASSQAE